MFVPERAVVLQAHTLGNMEGTTSDKAGDKSVAQYYKGQSVVYKELEGRKWRAAIVVSVARNGDAVKLLWHNGKNICDIDANVHLVREPSEEQRIELQSQWEELKQHRAVEDLVVEHEPLYRFLQRRNYKANVVKEKHVRLLTWNVKHYGATPERVRTRDPDERERLSRERASHDDERARNLVEVLHQSRCTIAMLQEVAKSADLEALCRLLDERGGHEGHNANAGGEWRATPVVGEHAMLFRRSALAEALGCPSPATLRVECDVYARGETLSPAFRGATDWASLQPRFDFAMQGASAARLPAVFFAYDGEEPSGGSHDGGEGNGGKGNGGEGKGDEGTTASSRRRSARTLAVVSVHLAFGVGGKSETRSRQLEQLASLVPGGGYDPSSCLFALLGDFNSNASVAARGHDFASSEVGDATMAALNAHSAGHVLALAAGKKTSIGGERFDEIVCHRRALGRRHAHVFPQRDQLISHMRAALPEAEQEAAKNLTIAFSNIFSDHLPVFVDLAFSDTPTANNDGGGGDGGGGDGGGGDGGGAGDDDDALDEAVVRLTCKTCAAGKGCRWRGRTGHLPKSAERDNGTEVDNPDVVGGSE